MTKPLRMFAALAAAGALALTACGGGGDDEAAAVFKSVSFSSMPAPGLDDLAAMATTTVGSVMSVHFDNDSKKDFALSYEPFFITGGQVPDGKGGTVLAGGYVDIHNQPIYDNTLLGADRQYFSDAPDGTSLLTVPNAKVEGCSPWCSLNTPPGHRTARPTCTASCLRRSPC